MFSPLITVDELLNAQAQANQAQGAQILLVDCRHDLMRPEAGTQAYLQGHLPGAVHLNLDTDLADHMTGLCGGRHPLPARERLKTRLEAIGLSEQTHLVAYDSDGGSFAARLWWLTQWLGHERVSVLDGGLPAWLSAGQKLTTEIPTPISEKLRLRTPLVAWVDVNTVTDDVAQDRRVVIDARAPVRFSGAQEPLDPVAGHIPGALNRFWQSNLRPDGHFHSADQLRAEFLSLLNGRPADAVTHQCGSGVTACHNLLAMAHAGLSGSLLYAGSWSEWCSDPTRPIATGS
jgi:thiosulfate/3-mercaptopyruvate sulfurtransferase